jgi:hypothetical protein
MLYHPYPNIDQALSGARWSFEIHVAPRLCCKSFSLGKSVSAVNLRMWGQLTLALPVEGNYILYSLMSNDEPVWILKR